MGARGTKPKDNAAAKAGVLDPLPVRAPAMKGGKDAQAEYVRLAKQLTKLGHLSAVNRQSLVNYCEAFALATEALAEVNDEGVTLESPEKGTKYLHPALNAWSMARATMEKEAKNLGMTPLSLQSIKNAKPQKPSGPPAKDRPSGYLTQGGQKEKGAGKKAG